MGGELASGVKAGSPARAVGGLTRGSRTTGLRGDTMESAVHKSRQKRAGSTLFANLRLTSRRATGPSA